MSRVVLLRLFFNFFLISFSTITKITGQISNDCLEWDLAETENYLDSINFQNVPTIDMMIGGFECPIDALPFGALKSDWARLTLLQKAQPKESALRKKLSRLFRILVVAYFQMEEKLRDKEPNSSTTSSTDIVFTEESTTSIITDPREGSKIFKENSSTNFPKTEYFTTTEGVERMSTTRKKGNSVRNRGDLPISTVTTANEIDSDENETMGSSEISVFADVNTELQGTLNNSVNPGGTTSATSEMDITKAGPEMRNEDPFHQTESYPTVSDFVEDKGSATNFTENQTDKGVSGNIPRQSETTVTSGNYGAFTVAESTANFIEGEINSSVDDILNERNKISSVDKESQFTTISGLEKKNSVNYTVDESSKDSDESKFNPISKLERIQQTDIVDNKNEFTTVSDSKFDNEMSTLEGTTEISKASDGNKFNPISKLERIQQTNTVDNKNEFTTVSDNKFDNEMSTLEDTTEISKVSDAFNPISKLERIENTTADSKSEFTTVSDNKFDNEMSTLKGTTEISKVSDGNKFNPISKLERIEKTTTADNKSEFTTVSDNKFDSEMSTLEGTTDISKASDGNKFNPISKLERIEQTSTIDNKSEFTTVSDNKFDNKMSTLEGTTEISEASDANKFYPILKLESPTSFTRIEQAATKKNAIDNNLRNDPTEAATAASTALTNSTDSSSESAPLIAASSPIVDIDVTTPESVVNSFETISSANHAPLLSTSTYFVNDVTSSTPSNSTTNENRENQSKRMDAGNYALISSASSEDDEENAVGGGAKSKFTTVPYYNSLASNFGEGTSSPPVSRTTAETRFYPKESAENKIAGPGEDFNEIRGNGTASKCHTLCNKIRKPLILKKPPTRNDFWKYIVRNVTLSTTTTRRTTDVTDESAGRMKPRKRGSLNTNVEKNFRWFYNIGQDESGGSGAGSHGINIECNEGKHGGAT